jgi:hypothetical protein
VEAYHVLIAWFVMSDAYAIFTNMLIEDRIYLEGLALWAGHDYSSTKGRDISHWADEYRRLIIRKPCPMKTYLQWSTSVHRVLHGERALRQLAEIVVYSTKCMGKEKALYVPDAMEQRIQRAGGLNGLIRCDEHAKPLEPREFTAFLAKAIETRKNPWPSQQEVQDGTAPMQIIQEFKAWQSQRGPKSPSPMSPRVKREPKAETGPTTPKGSYKEILKRDEVQAPITKFMSPKARAGEVERVVRGNEERLEELDPILQDLKQEVQQGAAGRRVLKVGAEDVEMPKRRQMKIPLNEDSDGARESVRRQRWRKSLLNGGRRRRKTKRRRRNARRIKRKRRRQGRSELGLKKSGRESCWRNGRSKSLALALHQGVAQDVAGRGVGQTPPVGKIGTLPGLH